MSESLSPELVVDGILHPGERDQFVAGCIATAPEEIPGLRRRVVEHLGEVEAAVTEHPAVDVDAARALAAALDSALQAMESDAPAEHRTLLRGAVEYFVDADDDAGDLTDPIGFDDDVRVANGVFEAIGRQDLVVRL